MVMAEEGLTTVVLIAVAIHQSEIYIIQVRPLTSNIQIRAPKTAAYYISPIEIGLL